jgi:D-lactate dehydrogenase
MRILYVKPGVLERQTVQTALSEHELIFTDDLDAVDEEICMDVDILSVFVDTAVDAAVLERFPKLSLIAARSTGFDHIDAHRAELLGITVLHVPRYGSQTVAEFAFTLMFAITRNAFLAYGDMQFKSQVTNLEKYEGFNLSGKKLGVVGTGLIGQRVCSIARCFGMTVLAYDLYPNEDLKASGVAYLPLDELLREADIVTLHLPSTKETRHMLNTEMLSLMRKDAYLVNTARGDLVDTHALVRVLQEGRIRGAALDVLEGERYLREEDRLSEEERNDENIKRLLEDNHALIEMENAIVTPHIAFNTREAKAEIVETTIHNIQSFMEGTIVNKVPS